MGVSLLPLGNERHMERERGGDGDGDGGLL